MLVHRILYAMKICMEQLPDDKLLPVLKALMSIWTGDAHEYQRNLEEVKKISQKEVEAKDGREI